MRTNSRFMERFRETDRQLQEDEEIEDEQLQGMTDNNFENAKSATNLKQTELFKLVAESVDNQKSAEIQIA
ncbi:hypothetical protein HAZT_HAZT006166 [Hyalella azteca]|uniref:Uncharacterized protein n=1 Tax=Hyalella azteca TaxID=294128 RepID=A0A6A0GZQ3_HYAAZ|nr:hypothetical protein HAZT_HAZT006166 [Hyalella azteca]